MTDRTQLVYGTKNPNIEESKRLYTFDELIPTQSCVYRHRLWGANRKYKKGENVSPITVFPVGKIPDMFQDHIPEYIVNKDGFYIFDGHARTLTAKNNNETGVVGQFVSPDILFEDDMTGTYFDQKMSFIFMTHGYYKSIDDIGIEKNNIFFDYLLSRKG